MPRTALPRPAAISSDEYRARRQALMAALPAHSAVLISAASLITRNRDSEYAFRQDSDFHYLSGFPEPDALLVLLPGRDAGEVVLFCQEKDPSQEAWTGIRIGAEAAVADYGVDEAYENDTRDALLPELLEGRETLYLPLDNGEMLALAESLRAELAPQARRGERTPRAFADIAPLIHAQRLIKSEVELGLMRHAARISAQAHRRAMQSVCPGLFEYQLQAELEHEFVWHGALAPAYATIVGGGENACVLHYIENSAALRDGDLVLIDAGGEFELYAGDITRTFPVNGRFTPAQRELYEIVLEAQCRAVAAVAPGTTLSAIHDGVVRDLTAGLLRLGLLEGPLEARIDDHGYRRFFLHATSHWLGLDVHDVGTYRLDGEPRVLAPGMVLTVEPGLYIPNTEDIPEAYRGIGIRIEDDVAVTATGHEVLTVDVPKEVAEIEALMREG
ncbi:aminopeptidase P Metallo peptidase. MEROPS family M24B [Chromohalobacter canadensis]|uniref:Xaa-Pro aminopeptidase n=1 Tax=Chromohalobacter canadensis TaxID=141389 RepID=A0A285VEA2_9GAMM|nr:Xaa-Pro aminopeptidase [Chromohalobacter canadensis]SOC51416.1 aminopeptidase P Metallo peptidase. MEROPS family M24B [Chromohalobacter canadensis]